MTETPITLKEYGYSRWEDVPQEIRDIPPEMFRELNKITVHINWVWRIFHKINKVFAYFGGKPNKLLWNNNILSFLYTKIFWRLGKLITYKKRMTIEEYIRKGY